jgi:integrase/recombinase XerD
MRELFEQFVRSRRYTKGVSERTVEWYWESWASFRAVFENATLSSLTKDVFLPQIEAMRKRGVRPVTINTYARAINAFLHWIHEEGHTQTMLRIPRLKEEDQVIPVFQVEQVRRLGRYRAQTKTDRRVQTVALLILDTGMRLNEVLSLEHADVDLDNQLVTVRHGKGGRNRIVPVSAEMRNVLYRYMRRNSSAPGLVFSAGRGAKPLQNNMRRDLKDLCKRLVIVGVKGGFHVLRHTFAVNYVRSGGDVFRLQRILGHSTLDMSRHYVALQTEDLQAVHQQFSVFANAGHGSATCGPSSPGRSTAK